jgi:hypothetical protein
MWKKGMHVGYWWENQKEIDHWGGRDVSGWIILRWILERYDGVVWIGLMWFRLEIGGGLL